MMKHYPVIVIGGGQAGLVISYCLQKKGIEHIILDRVEIGDSWKLKRWDNFTLVTPNWQCELPGYKYSGKDPNGFMNREEVVQFIQDYVKIFQPPIYNKVEVTSVDKEGGAYIIKTSTGDFTAQEVVIASGAFNDPLIPPVANKLPEEIKNIHSSEYKNAKLLGEKDVLIVGSGQSGCQIAEDLHLEGKKVHLCVGSAPKSPRNYRGRDVVVWLDKMGYYDKPINSFPDPVAVRNKTNHYVTGRDGGREIDLRVFALEGMKLYGLFKDIRDGKILFGNNLNEDLNKAEAAAQSIKDRIDQYIESKNIKAPLEPPYNAPWSPSKEVEYIDIASSNIGTVIWCIGFKANYKWLKIPVLDETGRTVQKRGVTECEGLYFIGLPWMYTWGSGRFSGIARDAWYIAEYIDSRITVTKSS
jgi:putative flavoprotein involved in K+ transport